MEAKVSESSNPEERYWKYVDALVANVSMQPS